ncbi:MarC family protein [Oleiagrimonas sp. C23AA]|uniref:MarC family protein n=1 Tax=Oleiagrimonas sp. C23AA TaxID=2719047 RepID=UPI001422DAD9|nr:MarC family protein [Oleiagrimonas sp. C23AA]NII12189.1 NAAT family transporter [Oleiagrimonas sp. C23AA]
MQMWMDAATVFMGFFAIMNPIANVPIFLGLTDGDDAATTRAVALRALLIAFVIVAVFALAGKLIFELFGLSLPALRITGGLLVFRIGFQMLGGQSSQAHHPTPAETAGAREAQLSVAVSPLAMPILAGPGTIATAMSFAARGGIGDTLITIGAFAVLCVLTFVLFISGARMVAFIGRSALGVITRMMGLILAVIGTQMVIEGIKGALTLVR